MIIIIIIIIITYFIHNYFIHYYFINFSSDTAVLFVDDNKVTNEVRDHLTKAGVEIKPYNDAISYVQTLSGNQDILKGNKIWVDLKTVNFAIYGSVPPLIRLEKESPIVIMKSTKNEVKKCLRNFYLCKKLNFVIALLTFSGKKSA